MRWFPMFLDFRGRKVAVAGGGEEAARKARLLARTEARLVLTAPALEAELAALVASGRATHEPEAAALAGAAAVFVATGDAGRDRELAAAARAAGALVNVVDRPELSDMIFPALVDRDPVVVAIGTEGAAPVLGRRIRAMLEAALPPALGPFAAMIRDLRGAAEAVPAGAARRRFWDWALTGAPWALWRTGDEAGARAMIEAAAAAGGAPEGEAPAVTFVALPTEPDLLPLRAVARLQAAGTVIHPEGIDPGFLEPARRDAARVALPACPRGRADLAALLGSEGPVVVLATEACGAAGAERLLPGSAAEQGRG